MASVAVGDPLACEGLAAVLTPYSGSRLVRTQTDKGSVSKVAFRRPLYKPNLNNDSRLHPRHLVHLFRGDTGSPMRALAVWQINKGTLLNRERLQQIKQLPPNAWRHARAHFTGKMQFSCFVVSNEQRVNAP